MLVYPCVISAQSGLMWGKRDAAHLEAQLSEPTEARQHVAADGDDLVAAEVELLERVAVLEPDHTPAERPN